MGRGVPPNGASNMLDLKKPACPLEGNSLNGGEGDV